MNPCFLCAAPTESLRSLTHITAPPAGSHDAVPICPDCTEHLAFAIAQIVHSDLAQETNSVPASLSFARHNPQAKL